jgi:hypothetical protein
LLISALIPGRTSAERLHLFCTCRSFRVPPIGAVRCRYVHLRCRG